MAKRVDTTGFVEKCDMTRRAIQSIWVLAMLVSISGCPASTGLNQLPDTADVAAGPEAFLCESVHREERFVDAAAEMGVSKANAEELYAISGAESRDVVTGFAPAQDRGPTVKRVLDKVAGNADENAFYVEVDIQNLGGLNNALGHSEADIVFARMTQITEQHMQGLGAKSCSFRHGGDEFSFVIIGPSATQHGIEAALEQADREIRQYIADKGLAEIEHPKHIGDPSKYGAGIIFGVSRIGGQETVKDVYGAADKVVEKKKGE